MNQSVPIKEEEYEVLLARLKQTAINWRCSSSKERISRLKRLLSWIQQNQPKIRKALWDDFQKPGLETDLSEIFPVTSEIKHASKHLRSWMKDRSLATPLSMLGTHAKVKYEPKGVALIISPWNYPFNLAIGPLVAALAAGCPAILKPSELTPHTSSLLSQMIEELFDQDEVSVVNGDATVAQSLLRLPFDHIFFTGSPQVGKIIMKSASKHLSSITLELGGKSPTIVTDSADINDAAKKIIYGKLINCGQTCIAPDYILVHESQKELLLAELKIAIQQMYDPEFKGIENSKDLARIVNERHFERLSLYLNDAVQKGANIAFGGNTNVHHRFIEPTILTAVNEEMLILQEEIFGPILPVLTYSDIDEAIDYINQRPKPLALYIFDQSQDQDRVLQRCSSGNAVVNECVLHFIHNEMPFGGVNTSGIGKAHGYFGFLAFSNEKGVLKQRTGLNNATLLRPPFSLKSEQLVKYLIKWF